MESGRRRTRLLLKSLDIYYLKRNYHKAFGKKLFIPQCICEIGGQLNLWMEKSYWGMECNKIISKVIKMKSNVDRVEQRQNMQKTIPSNPLVILCAMPHLKATRKSYIYSTQATTYHHRSIEYHMTPSSLRP